MKAASKRPAFEAGQTLLLAGKGGVEWEVLAVDDDMVSLRSKRGATRSMSVDQLWRRIDLEGWQAARRERDRAKVETSGDLIFKSSGVVLDACGEVVRGADHHAAAVVEWDRPVNAWTVFSEPSTVSVANMCDSEGRTWLHLETSSPERESEAQLTRESALQLAAELTRMAADL